MDSNTITEASVADRVKAECQKAFTTTEFLEVIDESDGCGAKLLVTIVSDEAFNKVPLIQRHRKVQKVLKEAGFGMDMIHAITIQAWTVAQWEKKKGC
mmetsp:Transcript_14194/g.17240  ORF Transcript_14194/g.17240 Transcript_14194/m.17240 type:complete len:98 (+) Transcript_14194:94-387(+)